MTTYFSQYFIILRFLSLLHSIDLISYFEKNVNNYTQGPSFVLFPFKESTNLYDIKYYNSTGIVLSCKAKGNPEPKISWVKNILSNFIPVQNIPNLRHVRANNDLIIYPFASHQFRQDVHHSSYQCKASNSVGTIITPEINLYAVIKHTYKLITSDEFIMNGNTGQLSCSVPVSVKDLVKITHWQRNDGLLITKNLPSTYKKNFHLLQNGELLFEKVNQEIASWKYRCIAIDVLNQEQVVSSWVKFIIKDSLVQMAPRILKSNINLIATLGDTLKIGCVAQANPVPSYHWFKENLKDQKTLLLNLDTHRPLLIIKNIQVNEKGVYICIANNTIGEDRKKYKVTILGQSIVTTLKSSQLIKTKEGQSVIIDCLLNKSFELYSQELSIEWLKNGKLINLGSRIKLLNQQKLEIISVNKEDKGMYQCIIKKDGSNQREIFFATFQLYIQEYAPEFRSIFKSHSLRQGLSINLKCSAFGSPLPRIRWYFYKKLLKDESYGKRYKINDYVDNNGIIVSYLNITNITRENGGVYSCEAFNDIGFLKHTSKISVFGSPYVHLMDNITIISSQKAYVDCPSSGHPIDSITWKKDGKEIPISRRIKTYSNGTLTFIDARIEDKGWYQCQVKIEQKVAHGSLYINVLEKPVINPFMFGNGLREGMRSTVICSILSGDTPLTIVWYKDHELAKNVHPEIEIFSFGEFTSTFQIKNVKRSHSGNYTCTAFNDKVLVNYTAEMIVQASPKWLFKPKENYLAIEGKNVMIDCQAEGYPSPIHQWKKLKQVKINNEQNELIVIVSGPYVYVLENGSLVFNNIDKSHKGDYVCEISNGVGTSLSAWVKLQVNKPVRFKKNFERLEAIKGENIFLNCVAYGDDPIEISWYKNQEPLINFSNLKNYYLEEVKLEESLKSILKISAVDFVDASFLTCQATNPYGKDEKNFQLIVRGHPDSVNNILVNEIKSRQVLISWSKPMDGNSQILGYIIQYVFNNVTWDDNFESIALSSNDQSAIITGLKPDSFYKIRIIAQNMFGKSKPSAEIKIKTDEEAPNQIPFDVRIESLNAQSLKIYWRRKFLNEKIDGYLLGYRKINEFNFLPYSYIFKTIKLDSNHSNKFEFNFVLTDLKRNTKYGIILEAFNKKGSGNRSQEVFAKTFEFDTPNQPIIKLTGVTHNKMTIEVVTDDENPVSGYLVSYKSNLDNWTEFKILGLQKNLVIENLKCGTKYSLTVTVFNQIGLSEPSELIHVSTLGMVPSSASYENLLVINSTSVFVNLNTWITNGCSILSFLIQYKEHLHSEWIWLSDNILPSHNKILISNLKPGTWYDLFMLANSEAGSTEAQYIFATLTLTGATIAPLTEKTYSNWQIALKDPIILAPICCTIFVFILIFITIAFLSNSKTQPNENQRQMNLNDNQKIESLSMTSLNSHQDTNESKKIYQITCRDESFNSYYSAYIGNQLSNTISKDTLRRQNFFAHPHSLSSNQTYDVPLINRYKHI